MFLERGVWCLPRDMVHLIGYGRPGGVFESEKMTHTIFSFLTQLKILIGQNKNLVLQVGRVPWVLVTGALFYLQKVTGMI